MPGAPRQLVKLSVTYEYSMLGGGRDGSAFFDIVSMFTMHAEIFCVGKFAEF